MKLELEYHSEANDGHYRARVVCDSVSPFGKRLTTIELRMPRFILAELNTHRMFSKNSASSRAIPLKVQLKMVRDNPFIPEYWGAAEPGMVANGEIEEHLKVECVEDWLESRDFAIKKVERYERRGLHKQIPNRLLEPFMWHTVVITATEWRNFYRLRVSKWAQPEMKRAAEVMRRAHLASTPVTRPLIAHRQQDGQQWQSYHLPNTTREEVEANPDAPWDKVSIGRCARTSYLTHDGVRSIYKDIELHDGLLVNRHMSPFEHVATPAVAHTARSGNFIGWNQIRKDIYDEDGTVGDSSLELPWELMAP